MYLFVREIKHMRCDAMRLAAPGNDPTVRHCFFFFSKSVSLLQRGPQLYLCQSVAAWSSVHKTGVG
jgi:hypothetical protein